MEPGNRLCYVAKGTVYVEFRYGVEDQEIWNYPDGLKGPNGPFLKWTRNQRVERVTEGGGG